MGLAQGAGQGLLGLRHRHEVHVVGHQTVRPDFDAARGAVFSHKSEVRLVIFLAEEGRQPPVAPLRDVVRIPGNHDSR